MDQELITSVTGNGFPELLPRPGCGRVSRHLIVENATAAADFHHEEPLEYNCTSQRASTKMAFSSVCHRSARCLLGRPQRQNRSQPLLLANAQHRDLYHFRRLPLRIRLTPATSTSPELD